MTLSVSATEFSSQPKAGAQWQRMSALRPRMRANCEALAERDAALADRIRKFPTGVQYVMAVEGNRIKVAQLEGTTAHVRPCLHSAEPAKEQMLRIFPNGFTQALLIAGIDQGWLWQAAYNMPIAAGLPGYRPPLYLLAGALEEIWIAFHLHDWRTMLADGRVRLMVGADAIAQFQQSLIASPHIPWPKMAITLDQSLWTHQATLDSITAAAAATVQTYLANLVAQYPAIYGYMGTTTVNSHRCTQINTDKTAESMGWPAGIASKLRGGESLRILGTVSRHTSFLQYSMRDWLAAMASLGHETRLLIENAPHEIMTSVSFAEASVAFKPDLILLIDHYRGEFGAFPPQVPCVMWVQDNLPNIFSAQAGASQGPNDYCLGFGRLFLSMYHGYPQQRYMPATVGVNEARFAPQQLSAAETAQYGCDVSYVGHASIPADDILQRQLEQTGAPEGRQLFQDVYDAMDAIYAAGGIVTHRLEVRKLVDTSLRDRKLELEPAKIEQILDFFTHRINNALFRHQALNWLAELDLKIDIYGRGWESHPRFGKYARGVADNEKQLSLIYQASKINLQVTPHGVVHQRLFEGLACGGFFLLRYLPGDVLERVYRPLWDWAHNANIASNDEFKRRSTPVIHALLQRHRDLCGMDLLDYPDIMAHLRLSADSDFTRSAASIWPEYDAVSFNTRAQLHEKVAYYLNHEPERQEIGAAMRKPVLERFTYTATSRRLLTFIADDQIRGERLKD